MMYMVRNASASAIPVIARLGLTPAKLEIGLHYF
jgi:ketopantoate hydroxymethyltransferase